MDNAVSDIIMDMRITNSAKDGLALRFVEITIQHLGYYCNRIKYRPIIVERLYPKNRRGNDRLSKHRIYLKERVACSLSLFVESQFLRKEPQNGIIVIAHLIPLAGSNTPPLAARKFRPIPRPLVVG
jgi:hypothetical protein